MSGQKFQRAAAGAQSPNEALFSSIESFLTKVLGCEGVGESVRSLSLFLKIERDSNNQNGATEEKWSGGLRARLHFPLPWSHGDAHFIGCAGAHLCQCNRKSYVCARESIVQCTFTTCI